MNEFLPNLGLSYDSIKGAMGFYSFGQFWADAIQGLEPTFKDSKYLIVPDSIRLLISKS